MLAGLTRRFTFGWWQADADRLWVQRPWPPLPAAVTPSRPGTAPAAACHGGSSSTQADQLLIRQTRIPSSPAEYSYRLIMREGAGQPPLAATAMTVSRGRPGRPRETVRLSNRFRRAVAQPSSRGVILATPPSAAPATALPTGEVRGPVGSRPPRGPHRALRRPGHRRESLATGRRDALLRPPLLGLLSGSKLSFAREGRTAMTRAIFCDRRGVQRGQTGWRHRVNAAAGGPRRGPVPRRPGARPCCASHRRAAAHRRAEQARADGMGTPA